GSGDKEELPTPGALAREGQILELEVVQQVQSHRGDGERVDRVVDSVGTARRGIAVAVRPKRRDGARREEPQSGRMQPSLGLTRVPRTELGEPPGMAGTNQKDVALADGHELLALGGLEILREHVLARLQP